MRSMLTRSAGLRTVVLTAATFAGLSMLAHLIPTPKAAAQNPHPGSAPVNIVAPLPLPVRDITNISEPFTFKRDVIFSVGSSETIQGLFDVPAGKRLIITHISAAGFFPPTQLLKWIILDFGVTGSKGFEALVPQLFATSVSRTYAANHQTTLFVPKGGSVGIDVARDITGTEVPVTIGISGYLIPEN